MDRDYVLCECELSALQKFVEGLEVKYQLQIAKTPGICLTMIKAEDSVEFQQFYLGEALTTECEVVINNFVGQGICLGDEPVRSYCLAVLDAILQLQDDSSAIIHEFLLDQKSVIEHAKKVEYNHILRTKVDFKLMEQE